MRNSIYYACFILLLAFVSGTTTRGQTTQQLLLGAWVKTHLEAKSGAELPITLRSKQAYLRFSFYKKGKGFKSADFRDKGFAMTYAVKGKSLLFGINTYVIEAIDSVRLVLLEEARVGFEEPAIRYTFMREQLYQNNLPAERETAIYRRGRLVYKESEKIKPELLANSSFDEFLRTNMPVFQETSKDNGFFVASFVVLPSGKLDTIQIHKGRNPVFDRQFVKAVQKTDGLWQPAVLDGQAVAVEKEFRFRYFTFASMMDYDSKYNMGVKLQKQGEYAAAIVYLSACVQLNPYDIEAYYHRAICYKESSQLQNACTDWQHVKALGSRDADEWLAKFCK
ncbi:energy transducer TonB [Hymenobacter sp. 5317J-9]|uniref:energy transducer TonB n=1 Tax=Hymenobacter sp. 5317J-9 TaxID=2932250 RepID=UPI001FD721C0|nr:energy transducer TonB [Hymenobacter sp. 5317J-9]UOQ95945.1 energy transducer TonB [Hymenobacter sp. 5317J-9]